MSGFERLTLFTITLAVESGAIEVYRSSADGRPAW